MNSSRELELQFTSASDACMASDACRLTNAYHSMGYRQAIRSDRDELFQLRILRFPNLTHQEDVLARYERNLLITYEYLGHASSWSFH